MKNMLKILAVAVIALAGLSAQAAVTTNSTAGSVGAGYASADSGWEFLIPFTLDTRSANVAASNDSVVVLNVRSNTVVVDIRYAVVVSNGSTCVFDISDSRSTTQFIADVAGTGVLAPTWTTAGNTRSYQSNGDVRIWFDHAATGLVVQGTIRTIDYSPRR